MLFIKCQINACFLVRVLSLIEVYDQFLTLKISWCYELGSQPLAHTDSTPRQILSLANASKTVPSSWRMMSTLHTTYCETSYCETSYCETSSIAIPTRLHHARLRHIPNWFNANIKKLTKSKYKLHCQIRSAIKFVSSKLRLSGSVSVSPN
ncbi:hypothetical protein BpHYR1_023171 [Brachionus plicatilis]|uniref:Uncharacterized protein n=1 Tax=Brachionus plicatilis TaxID=10195 RepID=A0A3M7Q1I4_BRAPC|nr:hypothetical protein BpHYR1_023171 [Brachionus plicatilis]